MSKTTPVEFRGNKPRKTAQLTTWHAQNDATAALDPAMPIVDAHHHLYGTAGDADYYRLEDFRHDLDTGHRVIGTVYVEAYESGWRKSGPVALRPVGEVEMITALAAKPLAAKAGDCQLAAAIVCHADLTLGDRVEEVLQAHLAVGQGRVRGVRQRLATVDGTLGRLTPEPRRPNLTREPEFRRGFAHLAASAMSFDAWVYHTQLDELIELADAFPDTTIVVDHVGGPIGVAEFRQQRAEVLRDWEDKLRALAKRSNVYMKLGGMGMAVMGFGLEHGERPPSADEAARAWRPMIETCVQTFGTGRCLFESNFPVDKQSCGYAELWNAFKIVTLGWSQQERSDLFYRTACRAYRLPELERLGDKLLAGSDQ